MLFKKSVMLVLPICLFCCCLNAFASGPDCNPHIIGDGSMHQPFEMKVFSDGKGAICNKVINSKQKYTYTDVFFKVNYQAISGWENRFITLNLNIKNPPSHLSVFGHIVNKNTSSFSGGNHRAECASDGLTELFDGSFGFTCKLFVGKESGVAKYILSFSRPMQQITIEKAYMVMGGQ